MRTDLDLSAVAIVADVYPTAAQIHWFCVPEDRRGQGLGRAAYEAWEAALPAEIERVTVFAADSDGSGPNDPFWEKLGFSWRYTADDPSDLSYELSHTLWKGVNGHSTPEPILVERDDL